MPEKNNLMIRVTQIIFLGLLIGQLLFAGVIYFLMMGNKSGHLLASNLLFSLLPVAILFFLVGAAWYFNRYQVQRIPKDMPLDARLKDYQQRVLVRMALVEAGVLAVGVFAMIGANMSLYLLMLVAIGGFTLFRPRVEEFVRDYRISSKEEKEIS